MRERLLERGEAITIVRARLSAAACGQGGLVAVTGPAGIGKTRLVSVAGRHATRGGFTVLTACGHELEQDLPFGLVLQLLEPYVAGISAVERARLFAGGAVTAAAVFTGDVHARVPDPASVCHALYRLVATVALRAPLALVVDDVHWADLPSLRWLHYLARRCADLRVLTIVASRTDEQSDAQPIVHALCAVRGAYGIALAPLGPPAVRILLTDALGTVHERFLNACYEATGGNPFLVAELIRHIVARGWTPDASTARRICHLLPRTVSDAVLGRLRRLGPDALAMARAAAVLGPSGRTDHAAALAAMGMAAAAAACDRLRSGGILGPPGALGFLHPLVGSAVYQDIPEATRAMLHARAARLLAAADAPAARVAAQLLCAIPCGDAWVVHRLREAARQALGAGAPDVAAGFLNRALQEPPIARLRGQVRYELGVATALGDPRAAIAHLDLALRQAAHERARAEAALALAKTLAHCDRVGDAVTVLHRTAATVHHDLHARRLRAEQLLWSGWWAGHRHPEQRRAHLAELLKCAPAPLDRMLWALTAWESMIHGESAQAAVASAERAIAGGGAWTARELEFEIPCLVAQVFMYSDKPDRAAGLLESGLAALNERGWRGTHLAFVQALRADAAYRRGDLHDAEHDARTAWLAMQELGPDVPSWWWALATFIQVLTARGELAEAAALAEHTRLGEQPRDALVLPDPLATRGELRLAQGRTADAVSDLTLAGETLDKHGCTNPSWNPWQLNLALALSAGDPGTAHALATDALGRARRFAAPWAIGRALRTLAMLTPGPERIELLEESARVLTDASTRYEHAATLVEWGAALRRAGRRGDARPHLHACLDLADQCGARLLALRAKRELAATGARPRRARLTGPASLTPSESNVAMLAASGLGNQQIAQNLCVTLKTVEKHLTAAFAKLQIHSRRELPGALEG